MLKKLIKLEVRESNIVFSLFPKNDSTFFIKGHFMAWSGWVLVYPTPTCSEVKVLKEKCFKIMDSNNQKSNLR